MPAAGDQIQSLISGFEHIGDFSGSRLYVVRRDGLLVYSSGEEDEAAGRSAGALLGGLWQAALALAELLPRAGEDEGPWRLGFGASSWGILLLPLDLGGEGHVLCLAFCGRRNPAPLRNRLRMLRNHMEDRRPPEEVAGEGAAAVRGPDRRRDGRPLLLRGGLTVSFVNYNTREVNCKIVYYGPGLGGKTTNIQHIYRKTAGDRRGELVGLDTENERTLFFDFLPLDLGEIRGFKTRFHLYTVPGQVFYEASRKLVLRGVDGIVFVADSQVDKLEANMEGLDSLESNLAEQGHEVSRMPLVMQWNKRDLPNIAPMAEMDRQLNRWRAPAFEAVSIRGEGVFETLKMVSKLVLMNLKSGLAPRGERRDSP